MYFNKDKNLDTKTIVDEIERAVYAEVKHLDFLKHGRTLHRFVEGDISQVINFQVGCPSKGIYDVLWVNVGIRVPECMLRSFSIEETVKTYYHEYECNIRAQLGEVKGEKAREYDLHDPICELISDILDQIKNYVIPAFDALDSRNNILQNRRDYPSIDCFNRNLILLEESMIFGRLGKMEKAEICFNQYYDSIAQEYIGHKEWKSFRGLKGHLDYLSELADRLHIKINNKV